MRTLSSTVSIKLRTVEAFKKQIGHVRQHRFGQKSRQVEAACANLDASLRRLNPLIAEVARLQITTPKGDTIKLWRRALRNRSLRVLAPAAKAHLHLKLKVPHKEASNAAYIRAGEQFAEQLRPHLATLIANGMDDDCLDVLKQRTAKLKVWVTQQSRGARRLREVGDQEKAELRRARDLAGALHGTMLDLCEDDPSLLDAWNAARRIPKRIGPKRETGGHLKADKRKAKRDRSPTGRPFDFEEPLEIPPPEEPPAA